MKPRSRNFESANGSVDEFIGVERKRRTCLFKSCPKENSKGKQDKNNGHSLFFLCFVQYFARLWVGRNRFFCFFIGFGSVCSNGFFTQIAQIFLCKGVEHNLSQQHSYARCQKSPTVSVSNGSVGSGGFEKVVCEISNHKRCNQRTYVNPHIENRKRRIAAVVAVFVQSTYQSGNVGFKKSVTNNK